MEPKFHVIFIFYKISCASSNIPDHREERSRASKNEVAGRKEMIYPNLLKTKRNLRDYVKVT